ncbi:hypothetical protein D030_2379A, partial [Vibrio parahaemolyticus AQ3810]
MRDQFQSWLTNGFHTKAGTTTLD